MAGEIKKADMGVQTNYFDSCSLLSLLSAFSHHSYWQMQGHSVGELITN